MAARKLDTPRSVIGRVMARGYSANPSRGDRPAMTGALDLQAVFDDTMRQFPATMARLAE